MTLFYLPLESYISRYTAQWSAPRTGWLERNWIRAGVKYRRIEGSVLARNGVQAPPNTIKTGSVVDAVGRSRYCFDQISEVLSLAETGQIKDSDVIYLDDFWTPGVEALPYAFHLLGIRPRVYAFLHAQSVDEFDFTHPMRNWMRYYEKGQGEWMDGIFVCCPTLKDLVCFGGIAPRNKVHVTGHPFNSQEVMERMTSSYRRFMGVSGGTAHTLKMQPRENKVIWSSRWDKEKDPEFFLEVAKNVIHYQPDVKLVLCTSAPKLRSNDPELLDSAWEFARHNSDNFQIKEGLTKEEYYAELASAKVQFNCADQDFVAITLLEASVAGCYPIYPYFRSFPETFLWKPGYTYPKGDVKAAADMVCTLMEQDGGSSHWTREAIESRSWIHKRFDSSWLRMLNKMGVQKKKDMLNDAQWWTDMQHQAVKDPFNPEQW